MKGFDEHLDNYGNPGIFDDGYCDNCGQLRELAPHSRLCSSCWTYQGALAHIMNSEEK